jgi:hypothetical protein
MLAEIQVCLCYLKSFTVTILGDVRPTKRGSIFGSGKTISTGILVLGLKWPIREADQPFACSDTVMKERR